MEETKEKVLEDKVLELLEGLTYASAKQVLQSAIQNLDFTATLPKQS